VASEVHSPRCLPRWGVCQSADQCYYDSVVNILTFFSDPRDGGTGMEYKGLGEREQVEQGLRPALEDVQ